jgi:hypothetical protein
VQLRFTFHSNNPDRKGSLRNTSKLNGAPGFYVACGDSSAGYSSLILSKEKVDGEDLYSRLSNETWDCVVLERTKHYHGFGDYFEDLFLLVIN